MPPLVEVQLSSSNQRISSCWALYSTTVPSLVAVRFGVIVGWCPFYFLLRCLWRLRERMRGCNAKRRLRLAVWQLSLRLPQAHTNYAPELD